jgi:hypothetical protein
MHYCLCYWWHYFYIVLQLDHHLLQLQIDAIWCCGFLISGWSPYGGIGTSFQCKGGPCYKS